MRNDSCSHLMKTESKEEVNNLIVFGELRGNEAFDMLNSMSMNTKNNGFATTIFANLSRLEEIKDKYVSY